MRWIYVCSSMPVSVAPRLPASSFNLLDASSPVVMGKASLSCICDIQQIAVSEGVFAYLRRLSLAFEFGMYKPTLN
jgi:hypothetical protein